MWCDNLPRVRGKLSEVTFPYKVIITNHSDTIEGNPKLFNYCLLSGLLKTLAYHNLPK